MPFYEYQCKKCGHHLEAMQKVHDAPLTKCPVCKKAALERLMSAPVFRLKGGGWYETDFKSDQEGKRNLADRPESAEPAKADGAKADSVKADKSDAKGDAAKSADKAPAKSEPAAPAKGSSAAAKPKGGGAAPKPVRAAKKPAKKAAKKVAARRR